MVQKKQIEKKPRLKFIDRLEAALKEAGIRIRRGGMNDYSFDKNGKRSERSDDQCEWVTIVLKSEDFKKKYEVEFFFSHNSTQLEGVKMYVKKKKKGYGSGNLIGLDKPKEKLIPVPPKKEPQTYVTVGTVITNTK